MTKATYRKPFGTANYSKLKNRVEQYLTDLKGEDTRKMLEIDRGYLVMSVKTRFNSRITVTMFPGYLEDGRINPSIYCKFENNKAVKMEFQHICYSPLSGKFNFSTDSYQPLSVDQVFSEFKKHLSIVLPMGADFI